VSWRSRLAAVAVPFADRRAGARSEIVSYLVMALRGRLGNNLWQFASGLGIARALGVRLCLDPHRVPEHDLLLPDLIGERYEPVTHAELRRVGIATYRAGPAASLARVVIRRVVDGRRRAGGRSPVRMILYEGDDGFGDELFALDPPAYVAGYFHDERFFASVADDVAAAIRWPRGAPSLPTDLGTTVGVSFRRGDYNTYRTALPVAFYDDAMRLVADNVERPTFVLFGDDPGFLDLFAERAAHRGYSVASGLALGDEAIAQLKLLSECDHAILANSSFAWWAAWLGDRGSVDDRMVVAPTEWGPVRESWTSLEVPSGFATAFSLSKTRRPPPYADE
jgi:hypothetical protein